MSEDNEDVIPNPRRKLVEVPEKYIPEHIKQNKIPVSVGNRDQLWNDRAVLPAHKDNKEITYDEVSEEPNKFVENRNLGISGAKIGEYILIHSDSLIATGDKSVIEEAIIVNSNIPENEFLIFKRCEVKIGVFVGD